MNTDFRVVHFDAVDDRTQPGAAERRVTLGLTLHETAQHVSHAGRCQQLVGDAIAATDAGRDRLGMDLDPAYHRIASDRLAA